jgi:hypothetical protein
MSRRAVIYTGVLYNRVDNFAIFIYYGGLPPIAS